MTKPKKTPVTKVTTEKPEPTLEWVKQGRELAAEHDGRVFRIFKRKDRHYLMVNGQDAHSGSLQDCKDQAEKHCALIQVKEEKPEEAPKKKRSKKPKSEDKKEEAQTKTTDMSQAGVKATLIIEKKEAETPPAQPSPASAGPRNGKEVVSILTELFKLYHPQDPTQRDDWQSILETRGLSPSEVLGDRLRKARAGASSDGFAITATGKGARYGGLMGYSITSIVRWCGKEGFTLDETKKALASQGTECPERTIKWYLTKGRTGTDGRKAPELTGEQKEQLYSAAGKEDK